MTTMVLVRGRGIRNHSDPSFPLLFTHPGGKLMINVSFNQHLSLQVNTNIVLELINTGNWITGEYEELVQFSSDSGDTELFREYKWNS